MYRYIDGVINFDWFEKSQRRKLDQTNEGEQLTLISVNNAVIFFCCVDGSATTLPKRNIIQWLYTNNKYQVAQNYIVSKYIQYFIK